jgi:hypothetical protein
MNGENKIPIYLTKEEMELIKNVCFSKQFDLEELSVKLNDCVTRVTYNEVASTLVSELNLHKSIGKKMLEKLNSYRKSGEFNG